MKARLITIGESEIRQRVEEEYQKKKDQIYESVIQDVLPQFMSVCMVGSFANVGVVKSICKQVQTAAYQGSNHGISATGGFTSHGYSCRNRVSFVN